VTTRTKKATAGYITSLAQYAVAVAMQFAIAPVVLKIAGQDTLGAFAVISQALAYLALIDMGLGPAFGRSQAQAYGKDDNLCEFSKVVSTGRTIALIVNSLYAILVFVLTFYIGKIFSLDGQLLVEAKYGLWIIALWAILRTPWSAYNGVLVSSQNMAISNIVIGISNVIKLGGSLLFVWYGWGLTGLMVSNVAGEAFAQVITRIYAKKRCPHLKLTWGIPDKQLLKNVMGFASQIIVVNISVAIITKSDHLIVGSMISVASSSVLYTTMTTTNILGIVVRQIVDTATPGINELYARGNIDQLRSVYLRLHRYTMILAIPLFAGCAVLTQPFVSMWVGNKQYAGHVVAVGLAINAFAVSISHVSHMFINADGKIRILSIFTIAEGLCKIILSITLVHYYGLPGIVLSTLIAGLFTTNIYLMCRGNDIVKVQWREFAHQVVVPLIVPTLLSIATLFLLIYYVGAASPMKFILSGGAFVFVYIISAILTGAINKQEVDKICETTKLNTLIKKYTL